MSRMTSCFRRMLARTRQCVMICLWGWCTSTSQLRAEEPTLPSLSVKRCSDFQINGRGDADTWNSTSWIDLNLRPNASHDYSARFKILHSATGIYILFDGTDETLTATMQEDFLDLWNEDVYEFFLWPDEQDTIYFEYEISPLGYELPILIPNLGGRFLGWRPWHYDGDRKVQKKVSAIGGSTESLAKVSGWRAEIYLPYEILKPLRNVPPKPDTRWRANFYRVDYDAHKVSSWDWARTGPSFHEFKNFGTLVFE